MSDPTRSNRPMRRMNVGGEEALKRGRRGRKMISKKQKWGGKQGGGGVQREEEGAGIGGSEW